jgi:hypothetical protein
MDKVQKHNSFNTVKMSMHEKIFRFKNASKMFLSQVTDIGPKSFNLKTREGQLIRSFEKKPDYRFRGCDKRKINSGYWMRWVGHVACM